MEATTLSTKGQIIIPKKIRAAMKWEPGQQLMAIDTPEGVLLKPRKPFKETKLEDVAGILKYDGKPLSLEEMDEAIKVGVKNQLS